MKTSYNQTPRMYRTDEWQCLTGKEVEVRLFGKLYRRGIVDMVMPDASALWLAADGLHCRKFIDKTSGFEIWSDLYSSPSTP